MSPATRTMRPRRGFTLIELLVSMVMFSIVGGAVIMVLNGQQRFGRAAAEVGAHRMQMQAASTVLPGDMRMLSSIDGDIISMNATTITIQSTIATGVVCSRAGQAVTIEPLGPLASELMTPAIGDSVFIWADVGAGWTDDTWRSTSAGNPAYAIAGVAAGNCAAPLAAPGTATSTWTLANTVQAGIAQGSPYRVTRRVTYGLYQAADGKWYLGYRDPTLASFTQVAGPFDGATGLRLAYFTAADVELTGAAGYAQTNNVARIEVRTYTKSGTPLSLGGVTAAKVFTDSLRIGVSLRNRNN